MTWITLGELQLIHDWVVSANGGHPGIRDANALQSALARPFAGFVGEEFFPDVHSKAAALIHALISSHPFVDGNKRTALVAADVCLRLNGYGLLVSQDVEPFFWAIARGEETVETITAWLRQHTEDVAGS